MEKEVTLLYTEDVLNMVYRIYARHQGKHGVPFITLKDFRVMFEEQQTALYKQQMDDIQRMIDDDPYNRFDS
jgi:hypothetical protein